MVCGNPPELPGVHSVSIPGLTTRLPVVGSGVGACGTTPPVASVRRMVVLHQLFADIHWAIAGMACAVAGIVSCIATTGWEIPFADAAERPASTLEAIC